MQRAMDVHALRQVVSARDKDLAARKPLPEAVKYISERYQVTEDSALALVRFLTGAYQQPQPEGEPTGPDAPAATPAPTKGNAAEVIHTRFDPIEGRWVAAEDAPPPL
ncbi:MAG: hypothetical protein KatS3mg102_2959 [Planctomycetota bacterium]|nr:MAG: hypothetical protein KatS3mg102_0002 [Planctomycetota bacterium]GIW73417.1 MAG: hypothetical protein KatS3mg102_2959 [Planctomycetota bacterium]